MRLSELTPLGRIRRPHGIKGHLKISVSQAFVEDIAAQKVLVIEVNEDFLPYFVESITVTSTEGILKFDEISTKEDAYVLAGKTLYGISTRLSLQPITNKQPKFLGFTAYSHNKPLGVIDDILEMPQQNIAKIDYENKEVLIPLHKDWIKAIDENNKIIHFSLPIDFLELF